MCQQQQQLALSEAHTKQPLPGQAVHCTAYSVRPVQTVYHSTTHTCRGRTPCRVSSLRPSASVGKKITIFDPMYFHLHRLSETHSLLDGITYNMQWVKILKTWREEEACDWLRPPRLSPPFPIRALGLEQRAAYDSCSSVCFTQKDCLPSPLNPRLRSMTAYMNLQYLLKFSPFSVGGSKPTYAVLFTPRPYKTCYI